MLEEHGPAAQTFGRRGTHVIGVDHFEHRAAHEAAVKRDIQKGQCGRRQNQVRNSIAEIEGVRTGYSRRRQLDHVTEGQRNSVHRERELQHQRQPKHRHGLAEECQRRNEIIPG